MLKKTLLIQHLAMLLMELRAAPMESVDNLREDFGQAVLHSEIREGSVRAGKIHTHTIT